MISFISVYYLRKIMGRRNRRSRFRKVDLTNARVTRLAPGRVYQIIDNGRSCLLRLNDILVGDIEGDSIEVVHLETKGASSEPESRVLSSVPKEYTPEEGNKLRLSIGWYAQLLKVDGEYANVLFGK